MGNLENLVYSVDDLPSNGDDVRVRPEPSQLTTYGQGTRLPGPKLQGVQYAWAQALVVDATSENGIGDPEANTIHSDTITQTPELFMSEANYQSFMN